MVTGFFVMAGLPVVYSLAAQQLSKCQPQLFRCMRGSSARLASLGSTIRRKQSDLMSQTMPTAAAVVPKAVRLRHPSWVGEINQTYIHSRRSFNDAKNRVLFAIMRVFPPSPSIKLVVPCIICTIDPLNCFVLCYLPDGMAHLQIRLSFLDCLDTRRNDPPMAIAICTTQHNAYHATCNVLKCATFEPKLASTMCIHMTRYGGKWVA
ncbi:hypothetical protein LEN26_013630 [Aphanomyces euteiches]|nr:hypothetical protein LEN26_013630 [Aphanomyces euteiches]KAH9115217.1 hypothetical protein AeMF1_010734 [Aphanomyces euteiches]KAH9191553.1 hypothetical protein AeNC1_006473 [Aphanomyces euteiches]